MANGYFERGEVYWVKMGTGVGVEMNVTRPGVIVSCDKMNSTSDAVIVAFLTTKEHRGEWVAGSTFATGRESWVLCNQVQIVDKTRLTKHLGTLTYSEMKAVDDSLENVFDLGYADTEALNAKDREIESRDVLIGDLRTEVKTVMARVNEKNEEIASLKMEIEMWQKCYGRCMDMLVDLKVNTDVQRRTVTVDPPKVVEEPVVGKAASLIPDLKPETPKVEQPKEDRLDINNCTATALKKIGFSLAMARKIVESRPFKSVEDLKRVNGLKSSQFRIMEPKLCCNPVAEKEPPKVEFVKDEPDPGYEVEQPEVVVVEPVVRRVNVNTAKAREIHEISGIALSTCYCITKYRKDNGPYKKIDDLLNAKQVGPVTLQRHGKFLEV